MVKCAFCGYQITPGTGIMYAKKDGKILHFCSSKCKKHSLVLGRKAIHLKWTKHYIKGQ